MDFKLSFLVHPSVFLPMYAINYLPMTNKKTPSCLNSKFVLKGVTIFWQKIICEKPKFLKWHALDCIKGKCQNCYLKFLEIYPMEKDRKHEIIFSWKCFQEVLVATTKVGEPKTVVCLEHMRT